MFFLCPFSFCLYPFFLLFCARDGPENHSLIAPAQERRNPLAQPDVSQAAVDVKWVQVVFECGGHDLEVKGER